MNGKGLILPPAPPPEEASRELRINCTTCASFKPRAPGSREGACHFWPPLPTFMGFQQTQMGNIPIIQNIRPGVSAQEGCRQHEPLAPPKGEQN